MSEQPASVRLWHGVLCFGTKLNILLVFIPFAMVSHTFDMVRPIGGEGHTYVQGLEVTVWIWVWEMRV
jgi:hypothetical protein